MWSLPSKTDRISTQVDGVQISAPASISVQELKHLRFAQVTYHGSPNALDAWLDRTLESMGYASRSCQMEAKPTDFGDAVYDVRVRAGGLKALRMQGGVTRQKKKTFLWITGLGAFLLLIGIQAAWLGALLIAAGGALWFLTPTAVHYRYKPAAVSAWIQGEGTAYKGTKSRRLAKVESTKEEHVLQTTYVDSEINLTAGVDVQVKDTALDRYLLREDDDSDGPLGLLKAMLQGKKEIVIGSKDKYAHLLPDEAALEKYALDDLRELRTKLAKASG